MSFESKARAGWGGGGANVQIHTSTLHVPKRMHFSVNMYFSVSSPVCAKVEVNMEDRVEVPRGQTAQITCTFTPIERADRLFIDWLYVRGGP